MKISENWLRRLVPIDADHEALVEKLNMIGHEVESVDRLGAGLDGVVVARIVECAKHPEADRLQVCRVDIGRGEPLQIVCGAPNARPGLKAPLATIGTKVGELTIKAAKLRGVESNGMLCSAKELGIDADASGLLELPGEAPVGMALADFLGLPDNVIDLGLTPNRADCLSLAGIALDVGAAFDTTPALPRVAEAAVTSARTIAVRLEAPADCPRYCGRYVEGIDATARTPAWMVERLRRCGLRPISLLVDVTNYVMLELGQPLHAFDADTLRGPIGVRFARAGETLKLLDEREIALDADMLVVTDADQAVALGGVMGGWSTRITDATRNVFLEAAHWRPGVIAGRARRLGMHTDAAHRFERGVDAELPRRALERAAGLIAEAAAGVRVGPIVEAVEAAHLPQRAPIRLRRARIPRLLGIEVDDREVVRILGALGLQVEAVADGWTAVPPSSRFDLAIEADLIEEVARIHGYDRIPTQAPRGELDAPLLREDRVDVGALRAQLAARDYDEAVTYAFVAADLLRQWGLESGAIALANPLSADMAVMRTSLLPGLVGALTLNRNRQRERVRLFEVGRVFRQGADGPVETLRIAGVAAGTAAAEQWGVGRRAVDFFDLKGDVESVLGLSRATFAFEPADAGWLHPGQSAVVVRDGVVAGWIGAIHPQRLRALGLDHDLFAFELDVEAIATRPVPRAEPLSRFPAVRRDIAVVVPETVPYARLEACVRAALGEDLSELLIFDQYAGPNLGAGVKSLAIGLILQNSYRTLTDADADRSVAAAIEALSSECQAKLRG